MMAAVGNRRGVWKPGCWASTTFTAEEKAHLSLLRKFRAMLNKITPSTFEKILVKMFELPVKSEKDLTGVMILLFDKARNEPMFSRVYANLCPAIAKEYKIHKKHTGEEINFRKVLLIRCQKEFEATDQDDRVMSDKLEILLKALKTAETDEEKARLNQEFKTEQTKVRHRKLGYMRFLGELYVLRMLTGNIMHQCVTSLLKASDEESLEYLCKLWTTIGKSMDSEEKARAYNDQYFQQMKKIATGQIRNVGFKIRFALKDVLELRENSWVPRRARNVPMTLRELHKQIALEEHKKQQTIALPSRNQYECQAPPLGKNNRRSDDQDGWSYVKISAQRVDPTKHKLSIQKMVGGDKELQLGPAKGIDGWSRGSSDFGKNTQQEEKSAVLSNRFSTFTDRETKANRSHSGNRMSSNRSGIKSRGCGGLGVLGMSNPQGSMQKKNSTVEMTRQLSWEPRLNSRENSAEGRNMCTPTPTGAVVSGGSAHSISRAVKQMKRKDWDTKMKSIIDEYLHNNDIKEVLEIVREKLAGQNEMMLMTECAINHTLERSTQTRRVTGLMLAELLKHKLLPLDAHIKGLGAVLEFADDLAIDIPNVWQYFGELIAPMFTTAFVPLDRLVSICNPLMSIGKASVLAAAVLKEASHNIGHAEIGKRWAESKLDWSKFLTEGEDRDEFIQSNNNWVPRRDKNIPKTLQEIHKQMAIEAHEKQQMIDKNLPSRNSQQGRAPPLPRNNRRSDDHDGWSHVKTSAQRVDPTKLKLTSQKMVGGDKELQLGPAKGFGGWSRGSSGSGKNTPPQQEEKSAVSSNRFSAFADRETRDNRSHSGNRMSSSRSGTKPRGRGGPGGQRISTPRGSMEKEKNSAVEMARQLSREPRLNSRENSVEGRNMRTPTPTGVVVSRSSAQSTPTAVKQMKRNDWDTKMKSIIDEYLHNNDIKEVLDIVREELSGQNEMMLMTECAINHTLERSNQARRGTGLMLAELLKHKLLPLDAHIKGLGAVLEFADDLAIDIPNVWQYFGELIAPMFTTASVPLDRLVSVCNPLMSIGKASVLAAAVLKEASHNIGHVEIGKRWAESKLDWSKFLTEGEDRDEFIQSNKLEYTLSTQPQAQSSTELLPFDVAAQLNKFMLEGAENESVFDWIDSKLSPDMCDDNVFIGSLTTSVVQSCIANGSLNESKFKSRIPLLNKYYDSKASRELAALSALENLMTKLQHPANLFSDLCYAVSENDLITDESFLNWEKSSNNEIAVKSVSKFLQWLKEGLTIKLNPTHYLEEPVLKATLSDRDLMPPPAPVVPSVPLPTTPPVTENKEKKPNPVVSSPAKASKSIPSHSFPLTALVEQKSVDGKVKTYTRDFLMSLKEANLSQVKPDGLDTVILQEITYSGRSLPALSVGKRDLNPEYFKPNSSPRGSMGNKRSKMSRDNKNMDATVGNRQHNINLFCEETFPGGQITTSVLTFPQQYYVMSSHTSPDQFCPASAMATQSLSAQEQSSARPASNPSISATVPPSNMMSTNSSPQQIAHNLTRMPTQTPAKPDITAQVKGQVAQVSSLSSSSVSVVSENTPPVLSSNVPSSSTEQTTSHPDKEASVKIISRNSSDVVENVAEAAGPAKDGKELSADVDIEQCTTDEQICSNDGTLEPIQTQVSLQEEGAAAPSTPVLIKSKQFDERQFVNSVAAFVDFTDIAASETSHKIYDREKRFLSTVTKEQESKGTCHQQESAATGSSVTSYLPDAARNVSDCRDSHLNLASEYNDREDQVGGAYANLGGAHTVVLPITESKSSIDEYLDNIDFKMDTKRASNSTHHLEFNMRRLLILSHVKIGDELDTALHYSAYLNQPDILKLLLERGSNVNAVNEGGCSTLHVAINNQHLDCVKVLIEHDCDVNIQDTYGDTPLHDAIGKDSTEIVRLLMGHADVDFSLKNKRGFNALHHAALKGNCFAVEKTLFRAPKMVDVPKDDGFSSLHIASLNGHYSVVQALLKQGHSNINLRNRRQQTPLMLACAQGHQAIVKILVESGASLTIGDEEGHTALHHVLFRLRVDDMTSFNSSVADQAAISDMLREATQESAAIAKVLAENNADILQVNFQGQAPLDLVSDYGIKTELEKYCTFPLCIVCEEEDARVIFLPCKHRCTCNYCSKRMKKCLKCQTPIEKKLLNGAELTRDSPPYQAVKELNIVLQEMEGIHVCEICMDRKRNTVFACGHTACDKCAQSLNICHNCRKPITLRIPLYI